MSKITLALFLAVALLCALPACAGGRAAPAVTIVETPPAQPVSLRVGQTLAVALRANPSTGYAWELARPLETLTSPKEAEYIPDPTAQGIAGAGGKNVWRFTAAKPGQETLELQYRRPWEKAAPPERVFSVQVRVAK